MAWKVIAFIVGLTLYLGGSSARAQNPDSKRINHWYFGQGAGLDFSSGTAVADTSGVMQVWKGSTTMSDTAGNLLFYSDGRHVWNAQHDTMPNGFIDGIWPNLHPQQATIAIPKPGDDDIYYIFTNDGSFAASPFLNGLQYHIVNMSLEGGLGDVVQANIPLYFPTNQQMCAVRHGNSCDYWLITHVYNTDEYLAFQITENGVDHTPVVSSTGLDYAAVLQNNSPATAGQFMKATAQGDKIATTVHWRWQNTGIEDEVQLSMFDNYTGVVSNTFSIPLDTTFACTAFSPSGNIFYAESGVDFITLAQYDISIHDSSNVVNSKQAIRSGNIYNFASELRLGRDGKLYGATEWAMVFGIDSMPVIHFPDVWGPGCVADDWGIGLKGKYPRYGSQNHVDDFSSFYAPDHACDVGMTDGQGFVGVELRLLENTLIVEHPGIANATVQLFDLIGRTCAPGPVERPFGRTILDVSNLVSGAYLVQVYGSRGLALARTIVKP